jgi:hypothetical protein
MSAAATALVVVVLLALGLVALFVWRLRTIAHRVGSFQCSLRSGSRWLPGVAGYTRDALVWYDVVSLSRRPRYRWSRDDLLITDRVVRPDLTHGGTVVELHCRHHGDTLELAAGGAAFEGLVSWLEASPPGSRSSSVI